MAKIEDGPTRPAYKSFSDAAPQVTEQTAHQAYENGFRDGLNHGRNQGLLIGCYAGMGMMVAGTCLVMSLLTNKQDVVKPEPAKDIPAKVEKTPETMPQPGLQ